MDWVEHVFFISDDKITHYLLHARTEIAQMRSKTLKVIKNTQIRQKIHIFGGGFKKKLYLCRRKHETFLDIYSLFASAGSVCRGLSFAVF